LFRGDSRFVLGRIVEIQASFPQRGCPSRCPRREHLMLVGHDVPGSSWPAGIATDIAETVLALVHNGFITGTVLHVDSGHRLA
jgi:hypothetical protein